MSCLRLKLLTDLMSKILTGPEQQEGSMWGQCHVKAIMPSKV